MFALSSRWAACSSSRLTPTGVAHPLVNKTIIAKATVQLLIILILEARSRPKSLRFRDSPVVEDGSVASRQKLHESSVRLLIARGFCRVISLPRSESQRVLSSPVDLGYRSELAYFTE